MRSMRNRILAAGVGIVAAGAGILGVAGPAQAAVTCVYNPNPVCHTTPTVSHYTYATSTALNVTPEPAVYSGVGRNAVAPNVSVHGTVKTLSSAGNSASKAGSVRIYFTRTAVTSTPVFMGTATVSKSGSFSKSVTARYSGSWRVIYSGNSVKVSSVKYTRMYASTSGSDFVQVRKVTRAAGTLRFAAESAGQVSSFGTDNYGFTAGRPVTVRATISSCTGPMGSFSVGVGGDVSDSANHAADATSAVRTDTFTAGAATSAFVSGLDASCNVALTLTQQRPAHIVTVN